MTTTYNLSLLNLPVEILHHILDYVDTSTIFLSLYDVCTYFQAVVKAYSQYRIDFCSISKLYFHRICRIIQPETILSLTLSDDNRTPGQIKLFLSLFNINQFTRLFSLHFIDIDDKDLYTVLRSSLTSTLTSLRIIWRECHCPSVETLDLLSITLAQLNLHRLELKTASYAITKMVWPRQYTLKHLTLMYITHRQYCTILGQTPELQRLTFNHCSMHEVEATIVPTFYELLTSLTLTDSRMSINGLVSILILTPCLTYLKILGLPDAFEAVADGSFWEKFIRSNLTHLVQFQFYFTNMYYISYTSRDVQSLVSRFRTSFWLQEKQWFITCDYIDYLNQVMLYTIPLCNPDFTYESEMQKISYSTNSNLIHDGSIMTNDVRNLNMTLTKLITSTATENDDLSSDYVFRNVTKLTIDVDQDWSINYVQHLSNIVDLSRMENFTFNPDLNPALIDGTIDSISTLMALSANLSTLAIHPYSSSSDGSMLIKELYNIIPHHIKYLEITIRDIDSMKMILDHHEHLWSLTLLASSDQALPWTEFIEELKNRKRDFTYWQSYYSLHIWLNHAERLFQ
ncbi:unnamed protein product [Adineta ricciae]|uniref:F-box domain-containing protein n=1 Tax=Adineta ricciae TaxID=249248 RepID=A0A814ND60_ADIRI|nr:unnamed protein product [Adineta ricciae]CAF1130666.1 unnamed protein product [Adineta ricciae]